jgi:hypothetical protein
VHALRPALFAEDDEDDEHCSRDERERHDEDEWQRRRSPPATGGSALALGFTAGGAGVDGGASTGVSIRVKSLGPDDRGAGALDGTGGGAYGSTRSPASFA